jgi:nicotinamidase/pyrazinamidase
MKPAASSEKKALVVIDVQEDYTGLSTKPPFPYENAAAFIATLNG